MNELLVFIPYGKEGDLKAEQLHLFKDKVVKVSSKHLPNDVSPGDLVELSRQGADSKIILKVEDGGAKPGWIALSYDAARTLDVKSKEKHHFIFSPVAATDASEVQATFNTETREMNAPGNEKAVLDRIDDLAAQLHSFSQKIQINSDKIFTQSVVQRDEIQRGSKSGTRWAIAGIALTLALFAAGYLIG